MFKINKLHPALAVEIEGIDLASQNDYACISFIRKTLVENNVIVLRSQKLTPAQQISISSKFGPLAVHIVSQFNMDNFPEILILSNDKNTKGESVGIEDAGRYWHTDMSYLAKPSLGSILYAIEVPAYGGDTMFASMYSAYDALPGFRKKELSNLRAIHYFASRWEGEKNKSSIRPSMTKEQIEKTPPVDHPLIRTHPENGRKAIYAGGFTVGILDFDTKKAKQLLEELTLFSTQKQFVYRHKWQAGDIVFWDNRSTMHHALPYDNKYRRHMHRTTVKGDKPV